jgi:hypothetical protein
MDGWAKFLRSICAMPSAVTAPWYQSALVCYCSLADAKQDGATQLRDRSISASLGSRVPLRLRK